MKKKKKVDWVGRIPNWAWLLISLTVLMILWYWLSVNPKTSRSFPNVVKVFGSIRTMFQRGVLFNDIGSSMISVLSGFALGKVRIRDVKKIFSGRSGETVALNGVSMDISNNEFICVVGPSGCGKSTTLNIIAGLIEPTNGEVIVDRKKVVGTGVERGVVFQQYALFPWMTVKKNVQFGLKLQKKSKEECDEIAMKYIRMVGLEGLLDAYPKELSGGMK